MTVADDVESAIESATWTTITEPVMTIRQKKQEELREGYGWVDAGDETVKRMTCGRSPVFERTTRFEIFIVCKSETNYNLYKSNIEAIIKAKVVTSGYWDILGYPKENWTLGRYNFWCLGIQKVIT